LRPLTTSELIDDRALTDAGDDRFRHADFAAELADLVTTVKTPANVALFAPWGAGKTGLANLLQHELRTKPDWGKQLRFARFDAFKFAEAPLRRNFIAEMARQLDVDDSRFSDGLYQSTTDSTLRLDWKQLCRLIKAFGMALVLVALLVALSLLLLALALDGSTANNLDQLLRRNLISALPLVALVSGLVALATPGLTVSSVRAAPSTEEEFANRFGELLAEVSATRIVIFVDELDRCDSSEVVSTLETIKTFLEVDGCIFVVAADHQVLEQALRKRVRQETPYDTTNPYYSAGSAYLDKVFQFQITLPQLMPRRLTGFALDLVSDRPGVWERISRLDDVVSVLVPTHVISPRRVKVLLNSFALTYRMAERRAATGALASNLGDRAVEIARLVCLRCEFPLFAADIEQDIRLIALVQQFGEAGRDGSATSETYERLGNGTVPESVLQRARAYYQGNQPVADLLVPETSTHLQGDDDAEEPGGELAGARVQRAHAQQLVRYLLRTAHVQGPYSDLVHLESSGAGLSLDPADAQELQRAAADNDLAVIKQIIDRVNKPQQCDALRLLAGEVTEAFPGIEGDNVTSILLQTVALFPEAVPAVVDTLVAAVVQHQASGGPSARELRWRADARKCPRW
jgi:hypothetical protein